MKESKYYKLICKEFREYYEEFHFIPNSFLFNPEDNQLEDGRFVEKLDALDPKELNDVPKDIDYGFSVVLKNNEGVIKPEDFETEEAADKFYEQIFKKVKDTFYRINPKNTQYKVQIKYYEKKIVAEIVRAMSFYPIEVFDEGTDVKYICLSKEIPLFNSKVSRIRLRRDGTIWTLDNFIDIDGHSVSRNIEGNMFYVTTMLDTFLCNLKLDISKRLEDYKETRSDCLQYITSVAVPYELEADMPLPLTLYNSFCIGDIEVNVFAMSIDNGEWTIDYESFVNKSHNEKALNELSDDELLDMVHVLQIESLIRERLLDEN